ncbi:hypothetical protein HK102_004207 [Quaeritorhiza haematococci]|nr:hypothetical protein HK102_004207 [Quaeritorhiza haematococci]
MIQRNYGDMIQKHEVEDILNKFGNIGDNGTRLRINDVRWYQTAFVHASYLQSQRGLISWENSASATKLEFLGDAYLSAVVASYLTKRFPNGESGFLTTTRSKIVNWRMLSQFGQALGLRDYILLSTDLNLRIKDDPESRLIEDHFESFIGAIVRDFENGDQGKGYICARRFIMNLIENLVDLPSLLESDQNFKGRLQQFCQQLKWDIPKYFELPSCSDAKPSANESQLFWRAAVLKREDVCKLDSRIERKCMAYHEAIVKACAADKGGKDFTKIKAGETFVIVGAAFGNKNVDAEHEAAKTSLGNLCE